MTCVIPVHVWALPLVLTSKMRALVLCIVGAVYAGAGVVQGVVLEHVSGRALARTRVRLEPITGPSKAIQVRATATGQFSFLSVPDGLYRVIALRDGYFSASHGQRRPTGQGVPVPITRDSDMFTELRMRRMGAITGRVVDDNDIGIAGLIVVAYRARLPLRLAGRGTTDDRGVYRIHGLQPGKYWVRTAAHTLDDGSGLLPTYGPESRDIPHARPHDVALDRDTADADIRPKAGNLFRLGISPRCENAMVDITLSSETGRRTAQTPCMGRAVFEGLAPAAYEVLMVKQASSDSAFTEMFMDGDSERTLQLVAHNPVAFEVARAGSSQGPPLAVTLTGRRQDMGNAENEDRIELPVAKLAPGTWEISGRAGPGEFIQSVENARRTYQRPARPGVSADWHETQVELGRPTAIRVVVSSQTGQIAARVTLDSKGVAGAPVFLWSKDDVPRRSLKGWTQAYADVEGQVRFDSLPPGEYRLLATFDISEPDEQLLDEARAPTVRVETSQRAVLELPLWIAP
jgi:hypothetical protein